MPATRNSPIIVAGRVIQRATAGMGWLEWPLRQVVARQGKGRAPTAVFVVAPPRSGSTLTFQVLRSGLNGLYLSNIWNLLYATPALGGLISRALCKNTASSFQSQHGWVSGLCGEAEGLRFWQHWLGQGLEEQPQQLTPARAQTLADVVAGLTRGDEAFISGYLGHAFSVETLRKAFPGCLFVHLSRDLVSNAYSLYRCSPEKWTSLRPMGAERCDALPRYQQVVEQVIMIQRCLLKQSSAGDTLSVQYAEVCQQPVAVLDRLVAFAHTQGKSVRKQNLDKLPGRFSRQRYDDADNPVLAQIRGYAQQRLNELSVEEPHLANLLQGDAPC
jgi:hypothetical protein